MSVKRRTITPGEYPKILALFYGLGGTGKTTLAASFHNDPRSGPALIIDFGGNPDKILWQPDAPVIVTLGDPYDIDEPLNFLRAGQPAKHPFRKAIGLTEDVVFKTVVIDTFTDWQRAMIEKVTGDDARELIAETRHPEATKHGHKIQAVTVKTARSFLVGLENLNVILTCQQKTFVDFTDGSTSTGIFLYGSSKELVPSWVKLMGQMEQVESKTPDNKIEYVPLIKWQNSTKAGHTKNQLADTLGNGIKAPTATRILDLVEQYYKGREGTE